MNCRARTLRFCLCCCACTIRLCKRRTLRLARFQLMERQSTAGRRLAPAALRAASSSRRIPVSCIIVKVSRAERPRGSQRGYPCRKTAILIITIRRLLSPRSFTRPPVGIPCGLLSAQERRRSGLPRSTTITGSVRSRLDAGGLDVHDAGMTKPAYRPRTFWSQRDSLLRCLYNDGA